MTRRKQQSLTLVEDGIFPQDGGTALEALWNEFNWKAIRNCDGRFAGRSSISHMSPDALLERIADNTRTIRLRPKSHEVDGIVAARFVGGGGLLSYEKKDGTYIHTLNTESGLCRKLTALHLFETFCEGAKLKPRARFLFLTLNKILRFLPEAERTPIAPYVAAVVRPRLARAALR